MRSYFFRQFLIHDIPEEYKKKGIKWEQKVLHLHPDQIIIIQKSGFESNLVTIDRSGLVPHKDIEKMNKRDFHLLWDKIRNRYLEGDVYYLTIDSVNMFIIEYSFGYQSFAVCELIFENIEESIKYKKQPFFTAEVTFDSRFFYKNMIQTPRSAVEVISDKGIRDLSVGTIPFLWEEGVLKVVLVTNRRGNHWIFPKGSIEKNKTMQEVALMEANEEAGIEGIIVDDCPILIPYSKGDKSINLLAYPILVNSIKKKWLEERFRQRKVVDIQTAFSLIDQKGMIDSLRFLQLNAQKYQLYIDHR
ncbi:NUDIX domain-containing protein [Spirochaeta cellobiosiphila]|uniref:NUDIX domain-containing protein n=1 Tax=Spirochaeta cellobiosiphila TaxID=504483 RepID=UPI0004216BBB|nr:NUDIX domain-containing protein [Spirochaeta cellobiosiphila]